MKRYLAAMLLTLLVSGCAMPSIKLVSDAADPLKEYTLAGTGKEKVLVIPVRGFITDRPRTGLLRTRPSLVQEVVSHLRKAAGDPAVRAVVLKINTPGGTATATDILHNELTAHKEKTGARVVAALMDLATSGGYYLALSAHRILAHPTTVTGSVGVVFLRPKVAGLMEKIGVGVAVNKSGRNKDMGSPFRNATAEEETIMQGITDGMARRFTGLVAEQRGLDPKAMADIATARVYLAEEALAAGLIDGIGYLKDAVAEARRLAGLAPEARLVVYRRTAYPDDNIYNTATMAGAGKAPALIHSGLEEMLPALPTGFYYLWPAALN